MSDDVNGEVEGNAEGTVPAGDPAAGAEEAWYDPDDPSGPPPGWAPRAGRTWVVAVGNQKGGVTKTTVTLHLAAALGEMGRRVLVWDLDPNRGASRWFSVPEGYLGSFEVLMGDEDPEGVVITGDDADDPELPRGVHLLPARRNLEQFGEAYRVRHRMRDLGNSMRGPLKRLRGRYDYVFLDTAPNVTATTEAVYKSADWFLLAAKPERSAADGLADALEDIATVRADANPGLRLLGVVTSCVDRRTRLGLQLTHFLQEQFTGPDGHGAFPTAIAQTVRISEAHVEGQTLLQFDPQHKVSDQFRQLAREFEGRLDDIAAGRPTGKAAEVAEAEQDDRESGGGVDGDGEPAGAEAESSGGVPAEVAVATVVKASRRRSPAAKAPAAKRAPRKAAAKASGKVPAKAAGKPAKARAKSAGGGGVKHG